MKIDPKLETILKKYHDNPRDAIWNCHGTWVAYHKALEEIAAKAKITFDPPQILEANGEKKVAAICVCGTMGDRKEWSIGEAAPHNNKNAYPWAMAEKRAKDRVILKLIGLHGSVYSEEEADDFRPNNWTVAQVREGMNEFHKEGTACDDLDQFLAYLNSDEAQEIMTQVQRVKPDWWHGDGKDSKGMNAWIESRKAELQEKAA